MHDNEGRHRSRANAAGQAHFSWQAAFGDFFDHSKPVFDPEKNEPVPALEHLHEGQSRDARHV